MEASIRQRWLRAVVVCGLAYPVVGIATAALAGSAQSVQTRNLWRLAAWTLSLVVFAGQLLYEHRTIRSSSIRAALHCAAAVALGAFLLAAAGPTRTHWHTEDRWRVAALSLVLWPLVTGLPAFVVALAAGTALQAMNGRATTGPS